MKKGLKKALSVALAAGMIVPMAACGSKGGSTSGKSSSKGKVLNIQCWNEEFSNRLADHYPGFKANDPKKPSKGGKIGDVEVKFTITPSDDNAYQNNLDEILPNNEKASADKKVDIFLVEADYAKKYINAETPVTEKISDLGITDDDLKDQYQYTKDVVTDAKGDLRGVSWQGCPGLLIYNRQAAKDTWGTDDPAAVQEHVKDWDTFKASAAELQSKGYFATSTVNDTYRVFSNNVTKPWVSSDNKIQIDDNLMKWVDMSKEMVDAKQCTTDALWSDEWNKGFYPDGKVFSYFGPAWLVNFSMKQDDEKSIAYNGGWGMCQGPQGFYWGGTWICAAKGTDNADLVKDIMLKLTCDKDIMLDIVKKDSDFVNNQPAMEEAKTNDEYAFKVLGGQNPLPMFCESAKASDLSKMGDYDQGCNESFQNCMKDYFDGNATKDEALDKFYKDVAKKYPNLSK